MARAAGVAAGLLALLVGMIALVPRAESSPIPVPDLAWTELLPPRPVDDLRQPRPVANCRRAGLDCVERTARRLRNVQRHYGCDHRGVFATTYLELTRVMRNLLIERPGLVEDAEYLYIETALFANLYVRTLRDYARGLPVPPAWQVTLDAATTRSLTGVQDMLMGISAHVQRDMPFVIARLGIRMPDGSSRKPDHDSVNLVLNRAYQQVVREVERRHDPLMRLTNSPLTPIDDVTGLELARVWREGVWRNAERLLAARDAEQRARVARQIEDSAAVWAKGMATIEVPGYRERRLEHCRAALGARG